METRMSNALIFISYSHKDERWKERLEEQLGVLEQEGNFEVWTDSQIGAGEGWYEKIDEALKKASVAILLVSASSLTSKFILKKEVKDLLQLRQEKDKRIFPIIIKDCLWEKVKWLAAMQVRPRDGVPLQQKRGAQIETALKEIAAEIAEIVGAVAGEIDQAVSQVHTPDQATRKIADEGEKERLNKLEAEVARLRKERDEFKSRYLSQGQATSQVVSGYGEEAVKPPEGESRKTTQDKDKPQFLNA
jgi:hypothetical protein